MNINYLVIVFLWLMLYSCIGWIYESTLCSITNKKLTNRGMLRGPICPIYGFGALAIIFCLSNVKHNPFSLFLSSMVVTCTLEYLTSYVLEKLFHTKWWDYSYMKFNLNGRICLAGALVFATLGTILMYNVHPLVVEMTLKLTTNQLYILSGLLFIIFIIDLVTTIHNLMQYNKTLLEIQKRYNELKVEFNELIIEETSEARLEFLARVEELQNKKLITIKPLTHLFNAYPTMNSLKYQVELNILKKIKQLLNDIKIK